MGLDSDRGFYELGLVVWAEVAFVNGVRPSCINEQATEAFSANVEQQLPELIRQQFNHASVGMFGSRSAAQCVVRTCVFAHVALRRGKNVITARGTRGSETSADEVAWTLSDPEQVNIAAGQLASGLRPPTVRDSGRPTSSQEAPARVAVPGAKRAAPPCVEVNGGKAITGLDVVREAGAYRTVVTRSVPVTVSNRRLQLTFTPPLETPRSSRTLPSRSRSAATCSIWAPAAEEGARRRHWTAGTARAGR